MIEHSNPLWCYFQFSAQTYFPLQGKDKFPLDEGDIFESKFPLVAPIGLAAPACGSGIGQSPSNSAGAKQRVHAIFFLKLENRIPFLFQQKKHIFA